MEYTFIVLTTKEKAIETVTHQGLDYDIIDTS